MGLGRVWVDKGGFFFVGPEPGVVMGVLFFEVEGSFLFVFGVMVLTEGLLVGEGAVVGEGVSQFDSVVCHWYSIKNY